MDFGSFFAWRLRFALPILRRAGICRRKNPCERVLCILTGGLGDKLMALPAIRNFRSEFAGKEFTLAVPGITPPFFESEADRLVSISEGDTPGLLRCAMRGFDACFVNTIGIFDVRCELAAFLSGAADLRGPVHNLHAERGTIYNRPYLFGKGHETVVNFRGSGGSSEAETLEYPLAWKIPAAQTELPDVLLHPGSSTTGVINRWPADFYAAAARVFAARGLRVLAIGSPPEKPLLEKLREKSAGAVQIRHDLKLVDLIPLLAGSGVVIANDSGIGHLAASVGANLLTVMGANRPERVAPVGRRVKIIGPRCEFGGCYGTPHASKCKLCIQKISPQEVVDAAMMKLESAHP